jgi:ParB-like chromosome segregation protein Spo0J
VNDDPTQGRPEMAEPSDEELRAALEEQMRRITVDDVLVQTAVTLINLGGRRLGLPGPEGPPPEGRDLAQAQKAIEAARALLPLLPQEPQAPVRDALSQLQMAFAREAQGVGEPPADAGAPPAAGAPEATDQPAGTDPDEAERAKARSKIWTPPGT